MIKGLICILMVYRYLLMPVVICLLASSCRKQSEVAAVCKTQVFAYYSSMKDSIGGIDPTSFGTVNMPTFQVADIAQLAGLVYKTPGTYNTLDHSFYLFNYSNTQTDLVRISLDGVVTILRKAPTAGVYDGLFFDPYKGKLFCVQAQASGSAIMEIVMENTTYSLKKVAPTLGWANEVCPVSATEDAANGDVYYVTNLPSKKMAIEKYHSGDTVTTVVATDSLRKIAGLRFNKNDNLLYAIREMLDTGAAKYELVSISKTGKIAHLANIDVQVDINYFSACVDQCLNRYILSTLNKPDNGIISQYSASGTLRQRDTTRGLLVGLVAP
jgi:uncharacterized protein YjiK